VRSYSDIRSEITPCRHPAGTLMATVALRAPVTGSAAPSLYGAFD
jgi:hypothetical protein